MRTATSALGMAILLGLAGCLPSCSDPGSGNAGASSGSPIAESDFRQSVIDAACSGMRTCCESRGYTFNGEACLAALDAEFTDMPTAAEGYAFNATAGGACVDGIRDTTAGCGDIDDVAECELVFTGTLPAGAACEGNRACTAPSGGVAYCSIPMDQDVGTCAQFARAAEGEACAGSGEDGEVDMLQENAPGGICLREDGLFCEDFETCQPLRAVGDACSNYGDCIDGAMCDSLSDTCVAISGVGGPCSYDSQCVEDTYCASDLTCQPRKGAGAACETNVECRSYFCEGGVCAGEGEWPSAELCAGNYN